MIAFALLALTVAVLGRPPLVLQDPAYQTLFDDVKGSSKFLCSADRYTCRITVPIQLGVMSRCPDALLCETVFDQVLDKVGSKVDMSLVFIAKSVYKYPAATLILMDASQTKQLSA
jgi:hypothetical protein